MNDNPFMHTSERDIFIKCNCDRCLKSMLFSEDGKAKCKTKKEIIDVFYTDETSLETYSICYNFITKGIFCKHLKKKTI